MAQDMPKTGDIIRVASGRLFRVISVVDDWASLEPCRLDGGRSHRKDYGFSGPLTAMFAGWTIVGHIEEPRP